ncbi:MAG: carboxypeptidase regulatory-like domain-containing protein [Vicinamibacterales bacterium]
MRALLRTALVLAAAVALAGAGAPQPGAARPAGSIRGRVDIRRVAPLPERRPGTSDLAAPLAREATDRRRAVVFLETAPRGAFEDRDLPRGRLDQRRETFVPHVLAVMTGTTVDFPNSDATYHNVFSLSKTQRFDLGRYKQGRSKSVRFDRPGVVRVFCDIHSHMSAFIVVFSHPYFAVTDTDGRYRIDGVPPGTYTVAAWYEGETRETRAVTVPDAGAVELDLTVN